MPDKIVLIQVGHTDHDVEVPMWLDSKCLKAAGADFEHTVYNTDMEAVKDVLTKAIEQAISIKREKPEAQIYLSCADVVLVDWMGSKEI